jgi:hypothetical protein
MPPLQNIKPCTTLVVGAIESLYGQGRLQNSNGQLLRSRVTTGNPKLGAAFRVVEKLRNGTTVRDQARIIWRQTVCRKLPSVWFVRSHSAEKVVFSAICSLAGVSLVKIVNAKLTEKDFARLVCVVGHVAAAPLRLCELSGSDQFQESVEALAAENAFCYAVCDWVFNAEELAHAEHHAAKSKLTFLCPC